MATSKLQKAVGNMLDKLYPQFRIRENYRPDWLISSKYTKLELDFYIEELKIGVEIQGAQHYQYIPHFHKTYEEFEKRKEYDQQKRDLCVGAGIKLIEIFCLMDAVLEFGGQNKNENYNPLKTLREVKKEWKHEPSNRFVLYRLVDKIDKVASSIQKQQEIKQFKKKALKFKDKIDNLYFRFKYLNQCEQDALLEEIGVLEKIKEHKLPYFYH